MKRRDYNLTHKRLLDAAILMLAAGDGVSLLAMSRNLDLNRSTIYYHFKHKDELVTEARQNQRGHRLMLPADIGD